jgi:glycosyltransferase involved in cell wall biosynthesis
VRERSAANGNAVRILYVTRQLAPQGVGGIGTYVATLARAMRAAGHDVTIVSASPGGVRSTEVIDGVVVERFGIAGPATLWRLLERASWPVASRLQAAVSAWAAVRRVPGRFDVIEAPEWKAEGLLLGGRKGRLVVHLHLPQELVRRWRREPLRRWRGAAIAEWLERRTVRRARAVTATSRLSRTGPGGDPWLPAIDVRIVPPFLDLEWWRRAPEVAGTRPVVLFLGHLEHRKGPDVLLAALGQLVDEVPGLVVRFVGRPFEGPDGRPFDVHLREEAARLGIACEVLPVERDPGAVRDLYAAARVVAVPSRYETLSLAALEGFAAARPVALTDTVGAAEWVASEVPELVVPSEDPVALADALRPLLLDAEAAAVAGKRGQARVRAVCALDAAVAARLTLYEEVAA